MKFRIAFGLALGSLFLGSTVLAQRTIKRHTRASPPTFQPKDFAGVFFPDALSQLQGELPDTQSALAGTDNKTMNSGMGGGSGTALSASQGNSVWKSLISASTIEDIVKESKSRLDGTLTTPAKFAGGGVADARREFTLLATTMAVISQYPEEIRWQPSAAYAQKIFAKVSANCKIGSQPVFNEAKLRHQDLQSILKGTKIAGNADEVTWADTADRGPSMKILDWALRENLAPITNNAAKFGENQEDVLKYAELIAMFSQVIVQPGMTDADDQQYVEYAAIMTKAAHDVSKAVRTKDPELARTAVGRIDQACNKCHETYK